MHPILFKIGPITVYSYGVCVALAFLVCSFLIWTNASLVGIPRKKMLDFVIVILVSGLIGGRLLHVFLNLSYYKTVPIEIFFITQGGLAFQGALICSFIFGIIFLKRNSIPLWSAGDLVAPYAALGQSIGRIGCFLNGCCFGKYTSSSSLGVLFPGESLLRLPTQIFYAVGLLSIYIILRYMLEKRILKKSLIFLYLVLISFQRFFIDFLRGDIKQIYLGLTVTQLISIFIFLIALIVLVKKNIINGRTKV